MYFNLIIIKSA